MIRSVTLASLRPYSALVRAVVFMVSVMASLIAYGPTATAQDACLSIKGPIADAVSFVESRFDAKLDHVCIRVVPHDELTKIFQEDSGIIDDSPDLAGLYVPETSTIFLSDTLDLTKPFGLSFVVHELVHAYQSVSGQTLKDTPTGYLECEAYQIQGQYLRQHGLTREALAATLLGQLQASSTCDYGHVQERP